MGCPISKDVPIEEQSTGSLNTMSNAKSRLEWKLVRAKETPEPDFDLSDCMLTQIPSGIFVLCKVLRKEILNLSHNKITILQSGGSLDDLALLNSLNLNFNHFTRIPEDISKAENLRELLLSNNQIEKLPTTINKLTHLEHLDISHNELMQIGEINCMPNLRILNISGNTKLYELPFELATCDSLVDFIFDAEYIQYPPSHILTQSTSDILNYLMINGADKQTKYCEQPSTGKQASTGKAAINKTNKEIKHNINTEFIRKEQGRVKWDKPEKKVSSFIDDEIKSNELLELKLHEEQQRRKQEFLQLLRKQQENDVSAAQRLQDESESKRLKLISNIFEEEANVSKLVDQWLSIKNGPDPVLFEKERQEQERLLSQTQFQETELRKQEIISNMADMLQDELNQVQDYNQKRDLATKNLLYQETVSYSLLEEVVKNKGLENSTALNAMLENEKLQRTAVAALIAKNDSRTWGLVEQVRIIESQLATMTQCEIARKKLSADESLIDICEERSKLTAVLLDLLDQQVARKQELMNTLLSVHLQKEDDQQDFWLMQYQKLIDSQPKELSYNSVNIDPLLGQNLLTNGVVHYIPLLAKLFQQHQHKLSAITDDDLLHAGIRNFRDREQILISIRDFEHQQHKLGTALPTETPNDENRTDVPSPGAIENNDDVIKNECVICMETSCEIVFIPCGHLCCCIKCQEELKLCPMCRATIERRIKILPA